MDIIQTNIYETMILNKIPMSTGKPLCIIAYGPPASGKGYITKLIKKDLGITDNTIIDVNIDYVICQIPEYKKDISNCVNYFSSCSNDVCVVNNDILPIDTLIEKCAKIYTRYRIDYKTDIVTNKLLEYAIANKINFIFETTGSSIEWTKSDVIDKAKANGFDVVLFFPVANGSVIKKRLYSRAQIEGRYPSPDYVSDVIAKAHNNFTDIYKCVDQLYVYNNNKDDAIPKLILNIKNSSVVVNLSEEDITELDDIMLKPTIDMLCFESMILQFEKLSI